MPRLLSEADFEIRPSTIPGAGMGLFSRIRIQRGDTIGYYTGRILTDTQVEREPYLSSLYLLWICRDHWILGEGRGSNYTRYINHSRKKPNLELITSTRWKTARFAAMRPIAPGTELFFDYGDEYWDALGTHPE